MSLVVKPHHPWKTRALWALAGLLMLVGGYTLFDYGRYLAGYDSDEASRVKKELLQVKKRLEGEIDVLRQDKALLQRARQIERQAYDDLDGTIRNLQSEILELKEELAFYRGIVSPREASTGLQLQKFSLEPDGSQRRLRYRVVLTQVLGNDRLASGRVHLELEGLQGKESKSLTLKDVTENSVNELSYRFKYFQKLEGDIRLPDGFSLLRATLRILPRGNERNSIEKTIDWSIEEREQNVGEYQKPNRTAQIDSLIGQNTEIRGDVIFSGGLHVDGSVKGSVIAEEGGRLLLTLSERGTIEGEVKVPNVVVNGTVIGDVHAPGHVELAAQARVHGNVYYSLIEMAMGAEVNGNLLHQSSNHSPSKPVSGAEDS